LLQDGCELGFRKARQNNSSYKVAIGQDNQLKMNNESKHFCDFKKQVKAKAEIGSNFQT